MRKTISIMVIMVMIITLCTPASFAGSKKTKSMTAYSQALKSGDTVYCSSDAGIYKVDLEDNSVKCLVENSDNESGPLAIKLHKGFIYFLYEGDPFTSLCRVNASGGKILTIARHVRKAFVISKGRIYFKTTSYSGKGHMKSAKLNGKSKRTVKNVKIKMNRINTNAAGYRIREYEKKYKEYDDEGELRETVMSNCYLRTPSGKEIYLGSYEVCY